MKKGMIVGLLLATVGLSMPVHAVESLFEQKASQARQAYDQGEYDKALNLYLELESKGLASAELFYNLGNTVFKMGRVGQAVAYYRWALRRNPGDEDIFYNLQYARKQVKRPEESIGPVTQWAIMMFRRFSGQTVALAALTAYLLIGFCLAGMIFSNRTRHYWQWAAGIMSFFFLVTAIWAAIRITGERQVRWGVVVADQVEARNGPGKDYQVGFIVPEGREVRILGQDGDWQAVGLAPEGYKGWVMRDKIWEDR